MNFIENIFKKLTEMGKHSFTIDDAARYTGLMHGFDKHTLEKTLGTLVKQGKLVKEKNGRFSIAKERVTVKCTLLGTSKDYAFARPVDKALAEQEKDIFISSANLNGACHGDTIIVEVGVTGKERKYKRNMPVVANGKKEGRVAEIVERGFKYVVGIMSLSERGVATVLPDDRRFADSVYVANTDTMGAVNGVKVVLEILDFPSNIKMARGKVIEILGDPADAKVTTLSLIRSFGLFEEFSDEVIKEADSVNKPVKDDNCSNREDYRDRLIITIDGDDAKDFDDAISIKKVGDDYHLGVYIADVSHYVKPNSKLDDEAFKRGTSVYFPDYVLPMLPKQLSNGICSLNPNEDRFVLAVNMVVNSSGKVLDYDIKKGIICSKYRMTYNNVTKILEGDKELNNKYSEIVGMLKLMAELAKILIVRRNNAGQLDFDIPEAEIVMNDDGTVKDIHRKPRGMSERLIEQFMVLTNEVVAKHFSRMGVPFVYRVHETPVLPKLQGFKAFAVSLGLKFNSTGKEPSPKDFQVVLKKSEGQDYSTALSKVMLRSMQKARYDTENLGHFGLALKDYCHFTSPIRRYPDLTIHRIITEILDGKMTDKKLKMYDEFVANSAERSSTTERQAEEAERTVDDQKATEFMSTKIGEEFDGVISGVTEHGFYVELENTVEGFVSTASLAKGVYQFDEGRYMLFGNGNTYRIGQKVKIKVESTDIVLRHINFALIEN